MIKAMRRRDFKENELAIYEHAIKHCELQKNKKAEQFKQYNDAYQIWKTENKIEGIRY